MRNTLKRKYVKREVKIILVVGNWSLYFKVVLWLFLLCQMPQDWVV